MNNIYLVSIVYWTHLVATVLWFGGMMANLFIFFPTAIQTLDPPAAGKYMAAIMKKFRKVVYGCLLVLFITGRLMTFKHSNYSGIMAFDNLWSQIVFIKHIVIIVLVVIVVYAFEILAPKVVKRAAKGPSPELQKLQKLQKAVGMVSFIIILVILYLTSILNSFSAIN